MKRDFRFKRPAYAYERVSARERHLFLAYWDQKFLANSLCDRALKGALRGSEIREPLQEVADAFHMVSGGAPRFSPGLSGSSA